VETPSEENYLKAIYKLSDNCKKIVFPKSIASYLNNKPSSITDMLKRLSKKKLVDYKKYKGVRLTKEGKKKSLEIIRKHRLWELFLLKHLNFSWDKIHEVAEQLEHIKSPLLVHRLDEFLKFPTRDPHGDPIPNQNGTIRPEIKKTLSTVKAGEICEVASIKNVSVDFLNYLDEINVKLDTKIKVVKKFEYDRSMALKLDKNNEIIISEKVSNNLSVKLIKDA